MPDKARTIAFVRARKAQGHTRRRRRMPRQIPPTAIALEYSKAIERIVDRAWEVIERRAFPLIPAALQETAARKRVDASALEINELFDEIGALFFDSLNVRTLESAIDLFGRRTSAFQRAQLTKQIVAHLGVDIFIGEPHLVQMLAAFASENVALIKSVPSRLFDDIEKRVTAAVRTGARWETLADELRERLGVAKSDARRIARDQVGKLYSELNEVRQRELGVTGYIWRTSNDNRVRDSHEVREGKSFSWSDPPAGGHPGSEILCRCYAEPDLNGLMGEDARSPAEVAAEAERVEQERLAKEAAEAERLRREQEERERLAREAAEAERLRLELERLRGEAERLAKEAAEREAERLRKEKEEADRVERERLAKEQAEAERLRIKRERDAAGARRRRAEKKAEAERVKKEQEAAEQERIRILIEQREREEREREERARRVMEERERLRKEQEERERLAKEEAERIERERLAREAELQRQEEERLKAQAKREKANAGARARRAAKKGGAAPAPAPDPMAVHRKKLFVEPPFSSLKPEYQNAKPPLPVEQVVAPPATFKSGKEFEEWASKNWPNVDFDMAGVDVALLPELATEIHARGKEYPEVMARLRYFGTYKTRNPWNAVNTKNAKWGDNVYAHASMTTGEVLGINPKHYGDAGAMRRKLALDAAAKFHPVGTDSGNAILSHEFGHLVDGWQRQVFSTYHVSPFLHSGGVGTGGPVTAAFFAEKKATAALSRYALQDKEEGFAEAFASIYHSPKGANVGPHPEAVRKLLAWIRANPDKLVEKSKATWIIDLPFAERQAARDELRKRVDAVYKEIGLKPPVF